MVKWFTEKELGCLTNGLPSKVRVNLEGYRGYECVDIPLKVGCLDDEKYVVTYAHDGAEYAIATFWSGTIIDALGLMRDFCNRNNVGGKTYSSLQISRML